MLELGVAVKVTDGRYRQNAGIIEKIYEAGEIDKDKVFLVKFSKHHAGQFRECELVEIVKCGEIL